MTERDSMSNPGADSLLTSDELRLVGDRDLFRYSVRTGAAARVMRRRKVHLLLVVDVDNEVLGIITSNDLVGEKTLQCISVRGISRADALVRDVMTPQDRLAVISMTTCAMPTSAMSSPRSRPPDVAMPPWWMRMPPATRCCAACSPLPSSSASSVSRCRHRKWRRPSPRSVSR